MNRYRIHCVVFALLVIASVAEAGEQKAFVRTCNRVDSGDWEFGIAPSGCDADGFGDVSLLSGLYKDLIFDRTSSDRNERGRYVRNIHAVIRDLATDYIRRREPSFSKTQVDDFVRAVLAVGTQESYLSHYRVGRDGRLKLMTGDKFVSHGLMQINQRFHAARGQDNSFDLAGNLVYGMDQFYLEFKRAQTAGCVVRQTKSTPQLKFVAALRSAYSSYNGGSAANCRWANPRHAWAKNDKGFLQKFKTEEWKEYIGDGLTVSPLRSECMAQGDELCLRASTKSSGSLAGRPLLYEDGLTCLQFGRNVLSCAKDARTFQCLGLMNPTAMEAAPLKLATRDPRFNFRIVSDRDLLCTQVLPGLVPIGQYLRLKKDVEMRKEIGGPIVTTLKAGSLAQVLDYEILGGRKAERHYRVRAGDQGEGYLSVGGQTEQGTWLEATQDLSGSLPGASVIPRAGTAVELVRFGGAELLQIPNAGAASVVKIPARSRLIIQKTLIRQTNNEVYLEVNWEGVVGYIFAGRTYPTTTVSDWVKVLP